jgi:NADH:ubiquinone oxidoreductase subunit D
VYTTNGDLFDRYRIRLAEILESLNIVRQCVELMPAGDYGRRYVGVTAFDAVLCVLLPTTFRAATLNV